MKVFFSLLFLVNMACATCHYSHQVFMYEEPGAHYSHYSPLDDKGLHVTYYKNPKKNAKNPSDFCGFVYTTEHTCIGRKSIRVEVYCDFTGPKPALVVGQVKPVWVKCADPLLRVEFQEKPLETKVLSEARVTGHAIRYALPFVEGEDPHLDIACEDSKATIVFDLGPDNKQSTTIDFLNDLTMKFSPPKQETISPKLEELFQLALQEVRGNKTLEKRLEDLKLRSLKGQQ